ncbi:MAG: geranylgeranyl reductase family protein [Candidatus Aegiribacteria sp.]|nr:geranylgeranyl reductase family protein [Candidatus Aegiribacteria sp.]
MINNVISKDPILIVGGGPAGASCAWKLASAGIPCVLIDKASFPRDKVCGGALSARTAKVLISSGILPPEELEALTLAEHRTISLWNRDELLRTFTSQGTPVRIISRREFDNTLISKAAAAGASIVTGEAVVSVDPSSVTTSAGKTISFSNLVGADGCGSLVRKAISSKRGRGTGMGLEYCIPLTDLDEEPEEIQIHFGYFPRGYIWVISDCEKVNIGAGAVGSPALPSDIIFALSGFLEARGISCEKYQLNGAPIPSLELDRNLGKGNIYLAGDAAGLVDHVSGEGIGHAVESGFMVADCISSGGDREAVLNRKDCCISIVRQSVFYRHLLFSPFTRRIAMMGLRDNEEYAQGYWNIISGKESYNEMFGRFLQ